MRRRTLLRSLAVSVPLALAGCSGDGDDGTDTAEDTPTTVTTAEDDSGDGETPTPTPTEDMGETETPTQRDDETETPTPEDGDTVTETPSPTETPTPTATPVQAAQVVEVAPDGSLSFAPESFEISTGDTVAWVWRAGGHNVKADSTPGGSEWSGTPGGEFDTFDSGHRYSHTFETAGDYTYYCGPHEGAGMTGSFTVSG